MEVDTVIDNGIVGAIGVTAEGYALHPGEMDRHRRGGREVLAAGLTEIEHRGTEVVCIVVCDGPEG